MGPIQAVFLGLLLWIKCHSVQNQCWNGYVSGSSWDSYAQSYNSPYGNSAYDYSNGPTIYISTYPQSNQYDYYQHSSYNAYPNDYNQQPVVIVINGNDHDDDLYDVLNLVASMNSKTSNEPVYIPYPVPVPSNDNYGCEYDCGYSDCGCKSCGCCCSKSSCCDCGCNSDNHCSECKKRRSKSKCNRKSDCGCSNSDCGCNKCIKHKNDRY